MIRHTTDFLEHEVPGSEVDGRVQNLHSHVYGGSGIIMIEKIRHTHEHTQSLHSIVTMSWGGIDHV